VSFGAAREPRYRLDLFGASRRAMGPGVSRIVARSRPVRVTRLGETRRMKNMEKNYEVLNVEGGRHVKMWTRGVPVDDSAKKQLENIARMPFVNTGLVGRPDVQLGMGATVG